MMQPDFFFIRVDWNDVSYIETMRSYKRVVSLLQLKSLFDSLSDEIKTSFNSKQYSAEILKISR